MNTENRIDESQCKPLEVPEVVPGVAAVDFPEISDFLTGMKIKGSLFGFQKEDVYEKMQQLNGLYQTRIQQMREQTRGQLKQLKKQQRDEMEDIRRKMKEEQVAFQTQQEQVMAEARMQMQQELEESRMQMQQELETAKEQALQEIRDRKREEEEKSRRELVMIQEEMGRLIDHLVRLQNKVNEVAEEK